MTLHLHGNILTHYGIAANNRGETEGNMTTLQKIFWQGELYSTVSAEAIRFALRYHWQQLFEQAGDISYQTNRTWNDRDNKFEWKDTTFEDGGEKYLDDDLLGFMDAKAAAKENEDAEAETSNKKPKKGTTKARRGPLEISRAVSILPFLGETSFNSKAGEKSNTSLYGTEMHATSYQYGFSVTPAQLYQPERVNLLVDALVSLGSVGGNQGRFLYDFSPEALVFRITSDPAPRILYTFDPLGHDKVSLNKIIDRVNAGDVSASELVLAGDVAKSEEAAYLSGKGAHVFQGILAAAAYVKQQNWRQEVI